MPDQVKNGLIGVFVMVGFAILVFIILFLHPQIGDEAQTLYVRFPDVDKVNVGTRVTFAGRPVGEVIQIRDVSATRDAVLGKERIYPYELVLKIDSGTQIYDSDAIMLRTSGLLGERSVSIEPKHPGAGQTARLLTDKEVIFANEVGSFDELFEEVRLFTQKAGVVIDAIQEQVEEFKKQEIVKNLGAAMAHIEHITGALDRPRDWSELLTDVRQVFTTAKQVANNLSTFSNRLYQGNGLISRLVNNEELYLHVQSLLSKADTMMDDINHYGILFHNDKGWQRLRARRMNLLQALRSPQQFHNFFNDEINNISTSLSRVSAILQSTYALCTPACLLEDPGFAKVFADLLSRIGTLEENIKMYNQQLVDERCEKQTCQARCL